jgi:hypothetical protein
MQTGSSGTLIGWKSGQTTFVPLWDRMEGAWLRTQESADLVLCWFSDFKKPDRSLLDLRKSRFRKKRLRYEVH